MIAPASATDDVTGLRTTVCIVGAGPAGMMLGLLLARAGVDVTVVESHADFFRDFRGDTIVPSTLDVMNDLGVLDELLEIPHDELRTIRGTLGDERITLADFSHVRATCKFLAFMPQWDFLDFLARCARRYANFRLMMETRAVGVVHTGQQISGARVETTSGAMEIRANLVVAADGRNSTVRRAAGLTPVDIGAPMDVLWMRLTRRPNDPREAFGRIEHGSIFIMLERRTFWQCGLVIPKGSLDALRAAGISAFHERIARMVPLLADRVAELRDWDQIKLLTVTVNRLRRWYAPGVLCIGDAAHAMSPIGGVGVNLAIQDAVAAANLLAEPLMHRTLGLKHLRAVQRRREWPARATQLLQVLIQNAVIRPVLGNAKRPRLTTLLRAFNAFPVLRRIPAHLIGIGLRPERVNLLP